MGKFASQMLLLALDDPVGNLMMLLWVYFCWSDQHLVVMKFWIFEHRNKPHTYAILILLI